MKDLINKQVLQEIIAESLIEKVGKETKDNWKSPIGGIVNEVLSDNSDTIKSLLAEILKETLYNEEFKKILKEEFMRKVSKNILGKLEGAVEKSINKFKQDPILYARLIESINSLIK